MEENEEKTIWYEMIEFRIKQVFNPIYYTIKEALINIKYAYQRVVRGYDDKMFWNLDEQLGKIISEVTLRMADKARGYPDGLTPEKWELILNDISLGFGSYLEMRSGWYDFQDKEFKRLDKNFKRGLKLFTRYYTNLWD